MKYFKLMNNNEFIGAITSNDFICYVEGCGYVRSNETYGEYVEYNNEYYRTTWMKTPHTLFNYTNAVITEITQQEYNAYIQAQQTNETITFEEEPPTLSIEEQAIILANVEYVREAKIKEMSYACHQTIELGFDLNIRGDIKHFSLTTQDQLNLMNLNLMAQTQDLIPYHADGEECTFYTPEEINEIITAATNFKNYQLAYNNALKVYINTLDNIEDIAAIEYGTPIPDEYKSDVLRVLE